MKNLALILAFVFVGALGTAHAQYKSPAQKNHKMSDNRFSSKGVTLATKTDVQQISNKKIVFVRMPEKKEPTSLAVISNQRVRDFVASDKTARSKMRYMKDNPVENNDVVIIDNKKKREARD